MRWIFLPEELDYSKTLVKDASENGAFDQVLKKLNEKKKSQAEIDELNEKWKKLQMKVEKLKQASIETQKTK